VGHDGRTTAIGDRSERVAGKDEKGGLPSAPGPAPNSDPATATKAATATPKAPRARKAAPARKSDPDVIAADIERTRVELAETLDAIAEKVSPKRVAKRTTKKVAAAVKDTAHDAATTVKGTAHTAKDKVSGGSSKAKTAWAPDPGPGDVTQPTVVPDLPPAAGVEVPSLPTTSYVAPAVPLSSASSGTTYSSSGRAIKPEYIAAGAAVALLAYLLLRKRK
jgi:hypothetical protein